MIQKNKECFICGCTCNLEKHHCIGGTANRKVSEQYGLTIWLCPEHHRGTHSVHMDRKIDLLVKEEAQKYFEQFNTREEFRKAFGKSYL